MVCASILATAVLAGASTVVNGATIRIDVGRDGALAFNPSTVTAMVGDVLEYHFFANNHSVVQGAFDTPCAPVTSGGFFSGFMPTSGSGENANVFQVTVNDTNPIFFYCAQNLLSHCRSGMSGVVNPSGTQTLDAYQSAAASVQSAVVPPAVFGGIITTASTSSAPSPSASSGVSGMPGNGAPNSASADMVMGSVAAFGAAAGIALLLL